MSRFVKQLMMNELRRALDGRDEFLFLDIERLTGIENNEFRLALRQKNIRVRVVKNTLARIVLNEMKVTGAEEYLRGPTAIVWGGDSIVELARELTDWAKKNEKIRIKGGVLAGKAIGADAVVELSQMPTREELIGRVVGTLLGAATGVVARLQGAAGRVIGQLKAKAEEGGEGGE